MTLTIYLDNSTVAKPSEKAISAMMPYLTTYWGTPSAPHQKGQELYPALTEFYKTLYAFIGADEAGSSPLNLLGSGSCQSCDCVSLSDDYRRNG